MNTTYKPLPAIAPNGVTLLLGSSTGSNVDASLAHAKELVASLPSGSVLYLNTVQNTRSMFASARKQGLDPDGNGVCYLNGDLRKVIYILNVRRGDLYKWRETIKEYLYMSYIQYVMINSWEFSSKNSRYREEAIFLIKELTDGIDDGYEPVHSLVYAEETRSKPESQKIQRGGFGKLSGIASKIESISLEEQFPDTEKIDEMLELPEVKQMTEIIDPRIGTEDEPGIDSDEALRRFLARVKPAAKKEWEERMKNAELRMENEEESEVEEEEIIPTIDNRPSTINAPLTSIEELRKTPAPLAKMPIVLNNYSPDKAPKQRPARSGKVHSDILKK